MCKVLETNTIHRLFTSIKGLDSLGSRYIEQISYVLAICSVTQTRQRKVSLGPHQRSIYTAIT